VHEEVKFVQMELAAASMPPERALKVDIGYEDEENLRKLAKETFPLPQNGSKNVLLHSCCAPCSGAMVEAMIDRGLNVTIFFYNPNIHPRKEYEIRKEENKRYARNKGIPFVDCDYDAESWFKRMAGYELEPERGVRCTSCFDMRMEVTAAYAAEHGFNCFTTTNATSRWKDIVQVNAAGIHAAKLYDGIEFWLHDWQTDEMTRRKYEVSVDERFYKQEYCGCAYSLRDSNIWRKQQGIPPVKIGGEDAGLGTRYFEDVEADAQEESQEVVDQFFDDANSHFGDENRIEKVLQKAFTGRQRDSQVASLNNW
jgi:epoxyqueuosine reductase